MPVIETFRINIDAAIASHIVKRRLGGQSLLHGRLGGCGYFYRLEEGAIENQSIFLHPYVSSMSSTVIHN
jgi:hypothetical protein